MGGGSGDHSSSEEDGDSDWKSAINSVTATTTYGGSTSNGVASTSNGTNSFVHPTQEDQVENHNAPNLKHYQIKAQKLLDDILGKTIEMVRDPIHLPDNDSVTNEGGVRLFKHAPPGIEFDRIYELQGPKKKPRILPGKEIDEKSKKFKRQLQSVAVEGMDVIAAAKDACRKSLVKLEARDAAAKANAKREEERVAELKRIRGQRWLPSIAKYMQQA